MFVKH